MATKVQRRHLFLSKYFTRQKAQIYRIRAKLPNAFHRKPKNINILRCFYSCLNNLLNRVGLALEKDIWAGVPTKLTLMNSAYSVPKHLFICTSCLNIQNFERSKVVVWAFRILFSLFFMVESIALKVSVAIRVVI